MFCAVVACTDQDTGEGALISAYANTPKPNFQNPSYLRKAYWSMKGCTYRKMGNAMLLLWSMHDLNLNPIIHWTIVTLTSSDAFPYVNACSYMVLFMFNQFLGHKSARESEALHLPVGRRHMPKIYTIYAVLQDLPTNRSSCSPQFYQAHKQK